MKINEVRIGNWVSVNGMEGEVNISALAMFEDTQVAIEGIPLTEEWLLRVGFKEDITKHAKFYLIDLKRVGINLLKGLCLYYEESDKEWNVCFTDYYTGNEKTEMFPNNITQVHQLQNLYYALTGEELQPK